MHRSTLHRDFFGTKSVRWTLLLGSFLLSLVVGCWTEVPQGVNASDSESSENETSIESDDLGTSVDTTSNGPNDGAADGPTDNEAPPFDPTAESSTDPTTPEASINAQQDQNQSPDSIAAEPQKLLPWQTAESSEGTPDLFSKSKPVNPEMTELKTDSSVADSSGDSEDEFGDFLAQQYEGLLEKKDTTTEPSKDQFAAADKKITSPSTSSLSATPMSNQPLPRYGFQPTPLPGNIEIPKLKRPRKKKLSKKSPEVIADSVAPNLSEETLEPKLAVEMPAAVPTEDLFAESSELLSASPQATANATSNKKSDKEDFMPWPDPVDEPIEITEAPSDPYVGDRYGNNQSDSNPVEAFEPQPMDIEPEEESIAVLTPKAPVVTQDTAPRLASLQPLPAVPVLRYNTRHMAWLLGGKLGLARLAELEGATPSEVRQWTKESDRLASQLDVWIPPLENDSDNIGQRVKALLDVAAKASQAMASEYGQNHAALLEISLKTNALLVLCKKYPELAAPTARAVEDAAERAELPSFLWRKMTKKLLAESTPDEIFEAITEMHDRVESYLR